MRGRWEYVGGAPRLGLLLRVVLLQERVGAGVARAERAAGSSGAGVQRDGQPGRRAGDGGTGRAAWGVPRAGRAARRDIARGRTRRFPRARRYVTWGRA